MTEDNIIRFPTRELLEETAQKVLVLEKQVEAFNQLLAIIHSPAWGLLPDNVKIEMVEKFGKKYENKYETTQ